jgi:hypothetical protein
MPPLLNDDQSAEQVRSDNRSFGTTATTIMIHQQDHDRRQALKSSAEIVRIVSPTGQSISNHHHPVPTARSSSTKRVIKLPRWTSKHHIPSSNRNKNHRRSKSDMASMLSTNNLMLLATAISPRPTPDSKTIACATADLLSLHPLLVPNTPVSKERTATTPGPGPKTSSTNTVNCIDSRAIPQRLRTIFSLAGTNASGLAPVSAVSPSMSDWDVMFLKHVATPDTDRSLLPADLQEGQVWLHQRRLLHASLKNGQYHPVDHFLQVQASCRLNLLEMMGVDVRVPLNDRPSKDHHRMPVRVPVRGTGSAVDSTTTNLTFIEQSNL